MQIFFSTDMMAGGDTFNDTLVFDLSSAVYSTEGLNSFVEFPVYFSGQNDTVNAIDFWFPFNTTKLTFNSCASLSPILDVYSNYIITSETLSCTASTSSIFVYLSGNTNLISVKFQLNNGCDRIEAEDIVNPEALINGFECAWIITDPTPVALPEIEILTTGPFCSGSPISFSYASEVDGQNISNFNWNFGNGVTGNGQNPTVSIDVEGSNNIELQMTTELGCTFEATSQIDIAVGPVSSFQSSIVTNTTQVEFTATSTISQGSITGYEWNFGDGSAVSTETNPTHDFPASGPYQVTLTTTSDNGCSDAVTITVDVPVGIDEQIKEEQIQIFPNPAESLVSILLNQTADYTLTDECGRIVASGKMIGSQQQTLDISFLSAGVYHFSFSNETTVSTRKMIVR